MKKIDFFIDSGLVLTKIQFSTFQNEVYYFYDFACVEFMCGTGRV